MKKILVLAVLFLCSCSGQNVLAIHPMMTYGVPVQATATKSLVATATMGLAVIASTSPTPSPLLQVVVTAETVNIRDTDLQATGKWLGNGAVLAVKPYQDGWDGDVEALSRLKQAYGIALEYSKICTECHGMGTKQTARGFESMRVPCAACKGGGTVG